MRKTISNVSATQSIVDPDTGLMRGHFSTFVLQVSTMGMIVGTGSPESNVEGNKGQAYMDDAGAAGAVLWIKQQTDIGGDTKQGWVAVG